MGRSGGFHLLRWFFLLVLAAPFFLIIHMILLASSPPVVRQLDLHVRDWPAGAAPMRLVLLSDIHVSLPSDSPERLSRIVRQVNGLRPDLVLLAGDFLSTESLTLQDFPPEATVAPLAALRARQGVIAVLGNHDGLDVPRLHHALANAGVTLLIDQGVRVGPLAILGAGTSEFRDILQTISTWPELGGRPVIMMHSPDGIPLLPPGFNLVLAGHTHCGQIILPLHGPIETGSIYGQRYLCGLVREGTRLSVITGGIGTSKFPLRFGAPPDLWVIDIGR